MLPQDVRYALRLLKRSPAFAATATLTLALSIGANTAIWSAVKGILVAPLPYADPDRLVRLFEEAPRSPKWPMAPADFRDYRNELTTFDGIAAYVRADLQLGDLDRPEQLKGMQVSKGFFKLLGHPPAQGREFEEQDELQGSPDVAILSHSLWMRRFDGDPNVVGQTRTFSGRPFQVVGVLPPGFQHVGGSFRSYGHGEPVDIWTALRVPRDEHPQHRYSHYFNVVGRIKKDVGTSQMEQDLQRTSLSVNKRYPSPNSPWKPRANPLKNEIVGTAENTLKVLAGAALAMLVLACVNVAGLLLGRAGARAREIGTRVALGATRGRIAKQLLIESAVLATAGGVLGIAIAFGAIRALASFGPADLPRLKMIEVDAGVPARRHRSNARKRANSRPRPRDKTCRDDAERSPEGRRTHNNRNTSEDRTSPRRSGSRARLRPRRRERPAPEELHQDDHERPRLPADGSDHGHDRAPDREIQQRAKRGVLQASNRSNESTPRNKGSRLHL